MDPIMVHSGCHQLLLICCTLTSTVQVRIRQGTHRAPSLAELHASCRHGDMAAPHLLCWGEGLSVSPPNERQIAHQVPDPAEALALMASACWALPRTTHLLDKAVRSPLKENTHNSRGSPFITLPEQSLCSLPGRVDDPAVSRGHFSRADLRETPHPGPGDPFRGRPEAPIRGHLLASQGFQP